MQGMVNRERASVHQALIPERVADDVLGMRDRRLERTLTGVPHSSGRKWGGHGLGQAAEPGAFTGYWLRPPCMGAARGHGGLWRGQWRLGQPTPANTGFRRCNRLCSGASARWQGGLGRCHPAVKRWQKTAAPEKRDNRALPEDESLAFGACFLAA